MRLARALSSVEKRFVILLKGEVEMIYCCEEHVDFALDDIVDKYQTFPILTKISVDNLSTTCEYCHNLATYMVANK